MKKYLIKASYNSNGIKVNGRHVFSKKVSDKSNIDVSALNDEVYSLTIKTLDQLTHKKLVIFH